MISTTSTSPGAYEDPNAGDPIQYDEVRIEHDQGEVEIVVYNRAIPERRRGQALRDRQQGYQGEHGGRPGGERTMTQPAARGNSLAILCRRVEGASQLAHTGVRQTDKMS